MFLETIGPDDLYDLKAFRDFVCLKMKSLCIEISLQNKTGQMIDEYIPSLSASHSPRLQYSSSYMISCLQPSQELMKRWSELSNTDN